MRLTGLHLEFYRQRKCPRPQWAAGLDVADVSIHQLIERWFPDRHHNTLVLLANARQREGSFRACLSRLAVGTDARRRADCKKWLARIDRGGAPPRLVGWRRYLREHGFDPADAPYSPIAKEWETFPIVRAIRKWEQLTGKLYCHLREATRE